MPQPPTGRPRRGSRAKAFFIGLVIGLIVAVVAYFVGNSKGRAGLAAAQTRAEQAEGKVTALEGTNRLLQARGLVTRAAMDLEARNYGTATADIQSATKLLQTAPAGADTERVTALRTQLEGVTINVTDDVGRQRERLMDLARQMDTLLPPPSDTTPAPSEPQPETAHSGSPQ